MNRQRTPASNLASAGFSVLRSGLVANLLWIGALKFEDYEVENIKPLVTSSPLFSRLHDSRRGAEAISRTVRVDGHRASGGLDPDSRRVTASRRRSSPVNAHR
jgi:reactive chlorine resistance protein C